MRLYLCLLFLSVPSCLAWWGTPHSIVGEIARRQLNSGVEEKINKLLSIDAKYFREDIQTIPLIAPWLDDQDDLTGAFQHWHYHDLPYNPEGLTNITLDCQDSLLWALPNMFLYLNGTAKPDARPWPRSFSLRALIHLVGDLHQPMHCTTRYTTKYLTGDRGGNSFKLRYIMDDGEEIKNLHFFFDSVAGEPGMGGYEPNPMTQGYIDLINRYADKLIKEYPRPAYIDTETIDFDAWAHESHSFGEKAYDNVHEGQVLRDNSTYTQHWRPILFERVALAGYRLGRLLNIVNVAYTVPEDKEENKLRTLDYYMIALSVVLAGVAVLAFFLGKQRGQKQAMEGYNAIGADKPSANHTSDVSMPSTMA